MSDINLTSSQLALRNEARTFAREEVPRQLLLDMDADKVRYPREYVQKLAAHRLLGLRFPQEWGGRGLDWSHEVLALEEIGVLGASLACLFSLPSIVGEAIHVFGSREQKEKYLKPMLEGKMTVAEALTEPRGGNRFCCSDDSSCGLHEVSPLNDGIVVGERKRLPRRWGSLYCPSG